LPAKKAARVQERRRIINRRVRSSTRTSVKKAIRVLGGGDAAEKTAAVGSAISQLDRAASKGIIHRNNAARRKSRLMKHLNEAIAE
jgi:small subunit ribosomal protein S20